jgi:ATP-dependent DNA helicase RecQ
LTAKEDLFAALRRYWGYESFRPLQERIVASLLAGRDTAVVMPTGGGKSLCYQLPAVVSGQTAIVISPLIALMQDQVAQLAQMGIPSASLNSSAPWADQSAVMANAARGAYRLLYLSPERLVKPETIAWLKRVPLSFFAIDEAHCISEWGHEFRPEYRQLSSLRNHFPDKPIAAFTASATQRVRHDILAQLQLREPDRYILSFHRPNLRYLIKQCDTPTQGRLLMAALEEYAGENAIVYAPTIARVESTVDFLAERGVRAVPYHGQMDPDTRKRNQERWMSDAVRVLVGTVAFGLGINKPSVRAVIHLSLPKSLEQYYQEAGRAGRDGLPADCALLWRKRDIGLLAHFIQDVGNAAERERAWERYHTMRRFVESETCRHRQICLHFGETPKWETCGMCDICGAPPSWLIDEAPAVEQKTRPKAAPVATRKADKTVAASDPDMLEYLREWRRELAKQHGVPAFIILHDTGLEDLCRKRPASKKELLGVTGIGEKKAEMYGHDILQALAAYGNGARAAKREEAKTSPVEDTLRLLAEGRTLEEIAQIRERRLATVTDLVAELVERGKIAFDPRWVDAAKLELIEATARRLGVARMKTIKDALPEEVLYGEIRLVAAKLKREAAEPP